MLRTAFLDTVAVRIPSRRLIHSSSSCLQAAATAEKKKRTSTKPRKPRTRKEDPKDDWARDPNLVKEVLPDHPLIADTKNAAPRANPDPVTLEEVERFRPDSKFIRSMTRQRETYAEKYKEVTRSLAKAFKKQQLVDALELYDVANPRASARSKEHATAIILKKWGVETCRRTRQATCNQRPGEAFVVLNDLMQQARKSRIHMSFSLDTSRLCLAAADDEVIETLIPTIRGLQEKGIAQKTTALPFSTQLPDSYLQAISVNAGAFLEKLPDSRYRVTYNQEHPGRCEFALQYLTKTAYEHSEDRPQGPSLAFKLSEDPEATYSLQPFVSPQSLFSNKASPSTYRLSRDGKPAMVSSALALEAALSALRPSLLPGSTTGLSVDIMPGHHAFRSESTDPLSLPASFTTSDGADNIRSALPGQTTFSTHVPQSVLNLSSGTSQTYQRLTYSGLRSPTTLHPDVTPTLRLFVTSDGSGESFLRQQLPHLTSSKNKSKGGSQTFHGLCDIGWKRDIDVLLPDGPMDMRLRISHNSTHALPKLFQTYVEELNSTSSDVSGDSSAPPAPPLALWQGDQLYILTSSEVVRGGLKEASPSHKIYTEIAQDVRSRDVQSTCFVTSPLQNDDGSWDSLLEQSSWLADFASKTGVEPPVDEYADSAIAWP
ncbi:hypothetical protein BKA70DRAFT_1418046 [Coprinopsis sp. MPI-PUGE-AT-0042]|nr:hypothetical protein BKA70DRAFT_1418046 [Coprinopsis sp. MPI-PUGE-AT-0042]